VAVDEWLFWQMANLGPKAGEANHFRRYAPERLPYALDRFGNEMNRLYGVMNTRLKDRRFLAGHYSIADMACVGWIRLFERQQEKEGGETFAGFPHLKRWLATVRARPAVQRGMHIRVEEASRVDVSDPEVRAVLFGQRAK
jgi:GST-like protein